MRKALLLLACVLGFVHLQAQPGPGGRNHQKIEAMRVSFITTEMQLTPEEAEKFWPIYNEYREKVKAIRQSGNELDKPVMDLSEEEARAFIEQRMDREEELMRLKREYYLRLREVVSARKLILLERAERKFKEQLLREMQKRRQRQDGPPRRHKK
ncbi:MAG TPA: hypothetical protein ENJ88_02590 [Phaeodactylibacter sp.]|nr:hypothetical protein [Phaeodactylibacter sp.]